MTEIEFAIGFAPEGCRRHALCGCRPHRLRDPGATMQQSHLPCSFPALRETRSLPNLIIQVEMASSNKTRSLWWQP